MKIRSNTGLRGISKLTSTQKYEVRVSVKDNSKNHSYYVGVFPTIGEAVAARQQFIANLF